MSSHALDPDVRMDGSMTLSDPYGTVMQTTVPDERPATLTRPESPDDYDGFTMAVGLQTTALIGEDADRVSATILHSDTVRRVVIGKMSQVQSGNGFILPPNVPFPFTSHKPLYARLMMDPLDGSTALVSVFIERH